MGIQSVSTLSSSVALQFGGGRLANIAQSSLEPTGAGRPYHGESASRDTVSREHLREMADQVGKTVSVLNEALTYEIDEATDVLITRIVDRYTREVIRQIPPEEVVHISQRFHEYIGLIFNNET